MNNAKISIKEKVSKLFNQQIKIYKKKKIQQKLSILSKMNQRLFYSLSSNCLIRSHLFESKKSQRDLQFANRFRKMHLYNAIHSLPKQKSNSSQVLNNQPVSTKNLSLLKTKKKQNFIQGIMEQRDKSQNKLVKLKHLNTLKRPQTFNKSPVDSKSLKIGNNKKTNKKEFMVKAQQINKNKPQRLSLRLSTTASKLHKNQLCTNQRQKLTQKWQTGRVEQHLFDDVRCRRSVQAPSVRDTENKQDLMNSPEQLRKTQFNERTSVKTQKKQFNLINRISLHDQINQSHQKQQHFTHHRNFIENIKERYSLTHFKTHPNLLTDNASNNFFTENNKGNEYFLPKNGSLQKLNTLKQDDKQNINKSQNNKKRSKPAYIQKFLKTTQAKNKNKKQQFTETQNSLPNRTNEYHSENFEQMNLIEILHPEGQFSTHFEDQFNPW